MYFSSDRAAEGLKSDSLIALVYHVQDVQVAEWLARLTLDWLQSLVTENFFL